MRSERGSALLEVLILGFAVVFLVVQAILAMGRLQVAGEHATDVAQQAAVAAARTGDIASALATARAASPDSEVSLHQVGREYRATVSTTVAVVGQGSGIVTRTVTGRATATASPYRGSP